MGIKRRKQQSTRWRRKRRRKHRQRRSRAIAALTASPWIVAVEWDNKAIWYSPDSKDNNNTKIGAKATAADLIKATATGPDRLFARPVSDETLDMYYLEGKYHGGAFIRLPNSILIQTYFRNGGRPLLKLRHEISTGTRAHPIDLTTDSPEHVAARSRTLRRRMRRRKKRKKSRRETRRRKRRKTY